MRICTERPVGSFWQNEENIVIQVYRESDGAWRFIRVGSGRSAYLTPAVKAQYWCPHEPEWRYRKSSHESVGGYSWYGAIVVARSSRINGAIVHQERPNEPVRLLEYKTVPASHCEWLYYCWRSRHEMEPIPF